jgi:histidine triad (HIT) family protein
VTPELPPLLAPARLTVSSNPQPEGYDAESWRRRGRCRLAFGSGKPKDSMSKTLFQKICDREIPGEIVYEDDRVVAFRDIQPKAPVHVLIVPRKPIPRIAEAAPEDHAVLGHLLLKAAEVARKLGLTGGYRLVFNNGPDAGEAVPHLHCHILGGRQMTWPPG